MESIESRTPPRPGIKFPLSFTPEERLNTDSIKSPTIEAIAVRKPRIKISIYENGSLSGKIHLNKNPARIEQEIPPIKPTKLLFGLAATYPLVDFPNKTPKNQARESQIKTNIKNKLIM